MRAMHRTAFSSLRFFCALGAVLAGCGFVACADALHLDPPGTGGSVTQTGAGAGTCHSNPQCAYPTPVCDAVSARCVQCLVLSDCAGMPETVCSLGSCVCPTPDGSPPLMYCPGQTPLCTATCDTGTGTGGTGGAGTGGSSTTSSSSSGTGGMGTGGSDGG